jgi:hypothetical protein
MSMSNDPRDASRSRYAPHVRDGLCRHIRSKGMVLHVDERPENDSLQRAYLAADPNALAWDGTTWWCEQTSKTVGPDDCPCHRSSCLPGRGCFEPENSAGSQGGARVA